MVFAPNLPASSSGSVQLGLATTLTGVIPKRWVVALVSGPGPSITAINSGNDGTLDWGGNASLTAKGRFVNRGTLAVTNGDLQLSAPVFINAPGASVVVNGNSAITGTGSFTNGGRLELGAGERLSVGGGFTQSGGGALQLSVENGFTTGSSAVTAHASLAGSLSIKRATGFKAQLTDAPQIVTAHSISGKFARVSGLNDGAGLEHRPRLRAYERDTRGAKGRLSPRDDLDVAVEPGIDPGCVVNCPPDPHPTWRGSGRHARQS